MAKTMEELDILKQECESIANKLQELSEDELKIVIGGNELQFGKNELQAMVDDIIRGYLK